MKPTGAAAIRASERPISDCSALVSTYFSPLGYSSQLFLSPCDSIKSKSVKTHLHALELEHTVGGQDINSKIIITDDSKQTNTHAFCSSKNNKL